MSESYSQKEFHADLKQNKPILLKLADIPLAEQLALLKSIYTIEKTNVLALHHLIITSPSPTETVAQIKELIGTENFNSLLEATSENKETILHAVTYHNKSSALKCIEKPLLEKLICAQNSQGETAFHLLIKRDQCHLTSSLLDVGLVKLLHVKNKNGETPFELMVRSSYDAHWNYYKQYLINASKDTKALYFDVLHILNTIKQKASVDNFNTHQRALTRLIEVIKLRQLPTQASVKHSLAFLGNSLEFARWDEDKERARGNFFKTITHIMGNILNSLIANNIFDDKHADYKEDLSNLSSIILNQSSSNKHVYNVIRLLQRYLKHKDLKDFASQLENQKKYAEEFIFLGICYARGNGVKRDIPKAAESFFLAYKHIAENLAKLSSPQKDPLFALKSCPIDNLKELYKFDGLTEQEKIDIEGKIKTCQNIQTGPVYIEQARLAVNSGNHQSVFDYYLSAITTPFKPCVQEALSKILEQLQGLERQKRFEDEKDSITKLLDSILAQANTSSENKNHYQDFFKRVHDLAFPPFKEKAALYLRDNDTSTLIFKLFKKSKYLSTFLEYAQYLEKTDSLKSSYIDVYGNIALTELGEKPSEDDIKAKETAKSELSKIRIHIDATSEQSAKSDTYCAFLTNDDNELSRLLEVAKSQDLKAYRETLALIEKHQSCNAAHKAIATEKLRELAPNVAPFNPEAEPSTIMDSRFNCADDITTFTPERPSSELSEPLYPNLEDTIINPTSATDSSENGNNTLVSDYYPYENSNTEFAQIKSQNEMLVAQNIALSKKVDALEEKMNSFLHAINMINQNHQETISLLPTLKPSSTPTTTINETNEELALLLEEIELLKLEKEILQAEIQLISSQKTRSSSPSFWNASREKDSETTQTRPRSHTS